MSNRTGLILIFALLMSAACGPSSRTKALSLSLATVNAAATGFTEWDRRHQLDLVEAAPTLEVSQANRAAYYRAREPVVAGFTTAYRALAVASLDSKTPLPAVISVVQGVLQAVADLRNAAGNLEAQP